MTTFLCILGIGMAAGCVAAGGIALAQYFGRIPLSRRKG